LIESGYVTWLGAGDLYHQSSLRNIESVINGFHSNWFTGRGTLLDYSGAVVNIFPSIKFHKKLIQSGVYSRFLPSIQQESTVWHSELHQYVDWTKFRSLHFAGDYYLWTVFSEHTDLISVNTLIGGYRLHPNSISQGNLSAYKDEVKSLCKMKINHIPLMFCQKLLNKTQFKLEYHLNDIHL